jgi:hypothetical protein
MASVAFAAWHSALVFLAHSRGRIGPGPRLCELRRRHLPRTLVNRYIGRPTQATLKRGFIRSGNQAVTVVTILDLSSGV